MAEASNQQEPSMEEILASIRRIIAEDNEPEQPATAPPEPEPEPEPLPPPSVASLLNAQDDDDDILELTDEAVEEEPEILEEVEAPPVFRPAPDESFMDRDRLVSNATAAASTAAFSSLGSMLRGRGDIPLGNGSLTLEALVRELIRPMLSEWLDENLPQLVERLVRDEVRRLAGESR